MYKIKKKFFNYLKLPSSLRMLIIKIIIEKVRIPYLVPPSSYIWSINTVYQIQVSLDEIGECTCALHLSTYNISKYTIAGIYI